MSTLSIAARRSATFTAFLCNNPPGRRLRFEYRRSDLEQGCDERGDHQKPSHRINRFPQTCDVPETYVVAHESCLDEPLPKRLLLLEGSALVQAVEMSHLVPD